MSTIYKIISRYILKIIFIYGVLFNFVIITPAYAYIDPNAGGFFFQTVAPVVYGILGVIVVFWKRITGLAKGIISRFRKQDSPSQD